MRRIAFLITFIILNISLYSQDTLTIKGKTISTLEYYFDQNTKSKITIPKSGNVYEIKIPQNTSYNKITIYEKWDDMCSQVLILKKLIDFSNENNLDTIINDVTHIGSCLRMDGMTPSEYENFVGKWQNDKFEIYIYTDGEFYIKYNKNNVELKRKGNSKIIEKDTILLKTRNIQNIETGTFEDNSEIIRFVYKDGLLISDKLDVKLSKKN